MFRNYIKTAFRSLKKRVGYTVINVNGFAIGMACCLLIFMLVRHEWSYNRFHEHADHIYRTTIHYYSPEGELNYQNMMFPDFTPALVEEFPSIVHASRFVKGSSDFWVENESVRQDLVEVDAPFFQMFSFPFVAGDPATALVDPSGMVITERAAESLFGLSDNELGQAIGKTVSIIRNEVTYDFLVSGVAENIPNNSSLQFDIAISFENYDNIYVGGNNWGGRTSTYIQLSEEQNVLALQEAFVPFVNTQFGDYIEGLRENGFLAEGAESFNMLLQPITQLHQQPDVWVPYEESPHDPKYSFILAGIGLLILLIACINFMILSIGLSTSRAREVGMRKVLGAQRSQLIGQFWGEALLQTSLGLFLGLLIAVLLLPFFNQLTGETLSILNLGTVEVLAATIGLLLLVGFIAGGYPSLLLSRFQPILVLKGVLNKRGRSIFSRSLVVLQYTISIGFIVSTLLMSQQLKYLFDKDLGYDKERVMVVNTGQVSDVDAPRVLDHFKNTLSSNVYVSNVARAGTSFTRGSDRNTWMDAQGVTRSAYNFGVGFDYIELMGMDIVEGRNFSKDLSSDSTRSVLVNEALVREFEMENPVGQRLTNWLSGVYEEPPVIIGVVKDFHFRSLREEVQPAVMNMHPDYYNFMGAILIKIKPDAIASTIDEVEQTWASVLPGKPFTYSFLDEDVAGQYQTEEQWQSIVTLSAVFAILIASLGLFGLATLTVARRTREIGIRKVLGANVRRVVMLIAGDFIKLVLIASVLAAPLAFWGIHNWLQNFAYAIDISIWPFVVAPVVAVCIAILTISSRAAQAALTNPVQALRNST
ncbi:MAG: ABC transporter permease [Rhodothermaceae bacterium]|nr:ABC transporter permease [Rhodothermaceae bacterium]